MTPEERAKARARNRVSKSALPEEEKARRRKAQERTKTSARTTNITIPVKIGEKEIGRANLHPSGSIVFRIGESEIGKHIFGLAEAGLLLELGLNAGIQPVVKKEANG